MFVGHYGVGSPSHAGAGSARSWSLQRSSPIGSSTLAFGMEAASLFAGIALYLRPGARRGIATVTFGFVMLAIHAYVFFGPPPASDVAIASTALVSYATFAGVAWLLERKAERDFPQRS